MPNPEIAKHARAGAAASAVTRARKARERTKECQALRARGLTPPEIAAALGCSVRAVFYSLKAKSEPTAASPSI